MSTPAQRYTAVAIVLHWAIALAIAGNIALGWWMGEALEETATRAQAVAAFQLHKSIGLSVLALSLVRLGWRLANKPPALPEAMPLWERFAATATHWAFYAIMIAMPLSGWLYVSTGWSAHDHRPLEVPTFYFGLFQAPHLFGLAHAPEATRAGLAETFMESHELMAWGAIALLALHVGAALKHHFIDKDDVLARMVPGLAPPKDAAPSRALGLGVGFAAIALAGIAAVWAFENPPTGRGAAPAEVVHSHNHDDGLDDADEHADAHEDADHHDDAHEHDEHDHAAAPPPAPTAGEPPRWSVATGASSIRFSGEQAGAAFEGRFTVWRADIRFDPADLAHSVATVTVETRSATDGVPQHDQSLPTSEWFDSANYPTAVFRTTSIRARGAGSYEARGTLTVKGKPLELRLPFTLRINGDRAVMDGTASIDRREANLGMTSDPDAEWVSREINVRVHVEAQRGQ